MMRSSSGGRSGLTRMGAVGGRFRTESKTTSEVLPLKGTVPVAISYSTAPKENRSVRAIQKLTARLLGRHVSDRSQRHARTGEVLGQARRRRSRNAHG